MKKHSVSQQIIGFLTVLLFFVVPGILNQILNSSSPDFSSWNFPISSFFYFIFALLLFIYFEEKLDCSKTFPVFLVKKILPSTFCFCILFFLALIFHFFSIIFPFHTENQIPVTLPKTALEWIFALLNFIFAAFYEEIIYRFFIPETALSLIANKSQKKIWKIILEIFVMLLFAAGHIYSGVYGVLLALFAHLVLRFFYKKTGSIFPCFIAHAIYNIISLILL